MKRKPVIWNILTILVLLLVIYLAYYFTAIFINPNGAYNPFPPAPLPTLFKTSTPTPTIIPLAATWTPTLTNSPLTNSNKSSHLDVSSVIDHSNPHFGAYGLWYTDGLPYGHARLSRYYLSGQYHHSSRPGLQLDGSRWESAGRDQ